MTACLQVQRLSELHSLKEWDAFCLSHFGDDGSSIYKSGFFERKSLKDPEFLPEHVFVIRKTDQNGVADRGEIVSTLRVYCRQIYWLDGVIIKVMGIGEVCTRKDFRGKGLASRLFTAAFDYAREKEYNLISLHSIESVKPLYKSRGFRAVNTEYYSFKLPELAEKFIPLVVDKDIYQEISLRVECFETSDAPWECLNEVYRRHNRFIGTTIRSTNIKYWENWICNGTMRLHNTMVFIVYDMKKSAVGYAIAGLNCENRLLLAEVVYNFRKEVNVLKKLLKSVTGYFKKEVIRCPKPVIDMSYRSKDDCVEIDQIDDNCWMYYILDHENSSKYLSVNNHVVWLTDNF